MLWKLLVFFYLGAAVIAATPADAAQAGPPSGGYLAAPALDESGPPSEQWDLLAEVVKQAAEQPLHFVMSAGPIWLSRCITAVPWYGWAMVPALAYREWLQWPSKRWWDPVLDAAFLALGVLTATWSGTLMPLAAMRRRDRRALVHLAPNAIRRPLPTEHASS